MTRPVLQWVSAAILLMAASAVRAEQVEIVTYYPSPATTTDDLRVKRRVTVGPTYRDLNLDDPAAPVADGTLLVENGLGVGTTKLAGTAPNGKTTGNLTVNDVFLTSANAWASTLGGGAEPTNPSVVYLEARPDTFSTLDVYDALQLWKLRVARGDVRMTAWKAYTVAATGWTLLQSGVQTLSGGVTVFLRTNVRPPFITNGVITMDRRGLTQTTQGFYNVTSEIAGDLYEVTVAW